MLSVSESSSRGFSSRLRPKGGQPQRGNCSSYAGFSDGFFGIVVNARRRPAKHMRRTPSPDFAAQIARQFRVCRIPPRSGCCGVVATGALRDGTTCDAHQPPAGCERCRAGVARRRGGPDGAGVQGSRGGRYRRGHALCSPTGRVWRSLCTGKTSVIKRYCHNVFSSTYRATIGVDFALKKLNYEGQQIRLQLWDIGGQERFYSMTRAYYKEAHGALIVADASRFESSGLQIILPLYHSSRWSDWRHSSLALRNGRMTSIRSWALRIRFPLSSS